MARQTNIYLDSNSTLQHKKLVITESLITMKQLRFTTEQNTQLGEALVFQIDTPIRIPANRLYVQIEDYSFPFYFPEIKEGTSKFAIKKPSCKYTLLVENGSMLGIILQQN